MKPACCCGAGEMSKSDVASPSHSPQRNVTVAEHSCISTDSKIKHIQVISLCQTKQLQNPARKQSEVRRGINRHFISCASGSLAEKTSNGGGIETWQEKAHGNSNAGGLSDAKEDLCNSFVTEDKFNVSGVVGTEAVVESCTYPSLEIDSENKQNLNNELNVACQADQKPLVVMHSECTKGSAGRVLHPSDSSKDIISENVGEAKAEKADEMDTRSPKQKTEEESNIGSAVTDQKGDCMESLEGNQCNEQHSGVPMPLHKLSPTVVQEPELQARSRGSKLSGIEVDETEECASTADAVPSSAAGESDKEAKVEFDLNEGFSGDDGRSGEPNNLRAPECSNAVQLISPLPLPVSSGSSALPASITVASAAKRPFVPLRIYLGIGENLVGRDQQPQVHFGQLNLEKHWRQW
ncbi:hypothetical protein GH714_043321 [Hevea brasiliensis]|uniref:Uncharacterized protein n=1 Tax=Hevea brasiliensis TaxID=3981 RepID=A0A6A6K240_HEVBR|nr:hypothetical protein GH714_043321 [Hevea brasiliensis]